MATLFYNSFFKNLADKAIDLKDDTIKVMLVTSSYTPDRDSHEFRSSVTNEVSGTNYTAGGAMLANKTLTQDNTNDLCKWDADDVTWASSTITARAAVVYLSTGNAATDILICYIDFGSDKSSAATDFKITWNASGIATLTGT
jgi:hypothetical protein